MLLKVSNKAYLKYFKRCYIMGNKYEKEINEAIEIYHDYKTIVENEENTDTATAVEYFNKMQDLNNDVYQKYNYDLNMWF